MFRTLEASLQPFNSFQSPRGVTHITNLPVGPGSLQVNVGLEQMQVHVHSTRAGYTCRRTGPD